MKKKFKNRYLLGFGAGLIAASALVITAQALVIHLILTLMVGVEFTFVEILGLLLVWKVMTFGLGATNISSAPASPKQEIESESV